jgi:hypothetical protein
MRTILRFAILTSICVGLAAHRPAGNLAAQGSPGPEPIAYIGHGAMFDQKGQEVAPSLGFIREAQAWYRADLYQRLTKTQQAEFDKYERGLSQGLSLDRQSRLVLDAHVLDWLLDPAKRENIDRIRGKNNLMKHLLKTKMPDKADPGAARSSEPFTVDPELMKRLTADRQVQAKRPVPRTTTGDGGAAYRTLCQSNGVPIPPDMGNAGWVSRGVISKSDLFIAKSFDAEVLTFESSSPVGMCIALPRFDSNNTVQLDGVICLGRNTSKACFWDNEKNGSVFPFTRGTSRPFSDFGGGTELIGSVGGFCSDCHSGENPYIIHGTVLAGLQGVGLPTFPTSWHDPIVRSGDTDPWPENPGPMNAPMSCRTCHVQGVAGRFPHISTAMRGYCDQVLTKSINLTMPPQAPGSLAGTPEMTALLNWCNSAANGDASGRGDPHMTTFNAVDYDFQGAGEFVYLRNGAGLEIQTRQKPIATAGSTPPNPHTGLSSCVSVNTAVAARVANHRVTLQPAGTPSEQNRLELRIDGRVRTLNADGIKLSGGGRVIRSAVGTGIEIFFPDKTRLIATANFWTSQNTWYMNVDVLNTTGREGIIGAIAPGGWLPLLPDGTPMGPRPASLHQRYVDLNQRFADAWRVTNSTSLFDYAPGTSTATFTNRSWPPENPPCTIPGSTIPPAKPMDPQRAQELCRPIKDERMRTQCVFDVTFTGEPGFAKTYQITQQVRGKKIAPVDIGGAKPTP